MKNKCLCGHTKNQHADGKFHCIECYDDHLFKEHCSVFVSELEEEYCHDKRLEAKPADIVALCKCGDLILDVEETRKFIEQLVEERQK